MTDPFASTADPFGGSDGTDPFGGSDGTDPFDLAQSEFISTDSLVGRLVLVIPQRIETKKGQNGPYDAVFNTVVITNGPTTDLITAVPGVYEDVMLSSERIVNKLRGKVMHHRPVLGVINSQPSRANKLVPAYDIGTPTESQIEIGRKAWAFYQRWLDDRKAQATDPFSVG